MNSESPFPNGSFSNPPPSPPIPSPYGGPPVSAGDFSSTRGRGAAAKALLGLNIVADVIATVFGLVMWVSLRAMSQGQAPMIPAQSIDAISGALAMAHLALVLATAIVFLNWLHRAHRNLAALGAAGMEFTPGSAVGNFFIPFLNLVRPPQILGEVWKASDPEGVGDVLSWKKLQSPKFIDGWWVCWILAGVIGNVATGMSTGPRASLDTMATGSLIDIVSNAFSIVAALLGIRVVSGIVEAQDARRARTLNAPPNPIAF